MIEGLKPYAEYKESKVPWIGRVPSNWRVERTKWIFRSKKELNVGRRNTNVLSLTLRGVVNNDPDSPEGMVPKDYATYQLFRKHDLVFKLIDLENIRTSRVGLVHEDGIMSSAYVRLIPSKNLNIQFFYFQFYDLYTRAVFNALGAGVRSTLGATDLGELRIAIPPPEEQAAIVRFLDHANQKIDGFIRAKRKLIGLLNEQKQAIIHRAVTRGLHPDVPLKPSGIPWLGDIPQHWEVSRVCRVFRQVTRFIATGDEPKMSMSRHRGLIRSSELSNRAAQAATSIRFSVCVPGDLVLNKYQAHNGLFGAAIEKGLITSNYSVFEPLGDTCAAYFALLFASPLYRSEFRMRCQGVGDGMMPLYSSAFLKTPVATPSVHEQKAIVVHIEKATSKLSESIARTEREIALMQEYRTRLTADLVTGKLDVREAAAKLPELSAESVKELAADEALEEIETDETSE